MHMDFLNFSCFPLLCQPHGDEDGRASKQRVVNCDRVVLKQNAKGGKTLRRSDGHQERLHSGLQVCQCGYLTEMIERYGKMRKSRCRKMKLYVGRIQESRCVDF